jgi:hypothetical protein
MFVTCIFGVRVVTSSECGDNEKNARRINQTHSPRGGFSSLTFMELVPSLILPISINSAAISLDCSFLPPFYCASAGPSRMSSLPRKLKISNSSRTVLCKSNHPIMCALISRLPARLFFISISGAMRLQIIEKREILHNSDEEQSELKRVDTAHSAPGT